MFLLYHTHVSRGLAASIGQQCGIVRQRSKTNKAVRVEIKVCFLWQVVVEFVILQYLNRCNNEHRK